MSGPVIANRQFHTLLVASAFSFCYLAVSCDRVAMPQSNACPAGVPSGPAGEGSNIQWGVESTSPKVSASIDSIVSECIPVHHQAIATGEAKLGAFTDYEIAATASITYKISDKSYFDSMSGGSSFDVPLVFEAMSGTGVVLGSATSAFRIVEGGTEGTASAKVEGLSDEEVRRVASIRARWKYGR